MREHARRPPSHESPQRSRRTSGSGRSPRLRPADVRAIQAAAGNAATASLLRHSAGEAVIRRVDLSSRIKRRLVTRIRGNDGWSENDADAESLDEFIDWASSVAQAEAIVDGYTYEQWDATIRPLGNGIGETRARIEEALAQAEVDRVNAAARERAAAARRIVRYDDEAREYTPPGEPLQALLDTAGVDLERIGQVHHLTRQELLAADLAYEKARWELDVNETDVLVDDERRQRVVTIRTQRERLAKLMEDYRPLEAAFATQEAKDARLASIAAAVEAKQPASFQANGLCATLWAASKTHAGKSGKFELQNGYTAAQLQAAWTQWQPFAAAVSDVDGFATHRIGNGTAQDKRGRDDINTRRFTHQMNFSITWDGVTQMMHVGLAGTDNPGFTG